MAKNAAKENEYYSEPRCGTCMWHYRNPKLDEKWQRKVGPWVCSNEKCKHFNKATLDDAHPACRCWMKRVTDIWLARYQNMRRCKKLDAKGYQYTYRNLDCMYPDVFNFYEEHKNDIYHGVQRIGAEYELFVAKHFGILREDVKYCVARYIDMMRAIFKEENNVSDE